MDRFEAMTMLVKVTETGSFSAAGRLLNVPLATLSRKISDLETHLGSQLLIRTTRKMTLTDSGINYVAAARRIIDQVEEAEREAAGALNSPSGEVVITAPIFFGRLHVLPIIADFLSLYPEIDIRLMLADRNIDLIDAHVDLAVRFGELPDSQMVATRVGSMRRVLCASNTLIEQSGEPTTPRDLAALPCVLIDTPFIPSKWRFKHPKSEQIFEVAVAPRLSVTSTEAATDAAIRGVGFSQLFHYQVYNALQNGKLRILLTEFETNLVPVTLIHAARSQMPFKMRSFLDFAIPRLRTELSKIGGFS